MYIYYARKKEEIPKRTEGDMLTAAALVDEGYYVLISNSIYSDCKMKDLEKTEGKRARKKTYRIGRKGQAKCLIS